MFEKSPQKIGLDFSDILFKSTRYYCSISAKVCSQIKWIIDAIQYNTYMMFFFLLIIHVMICLAQGFSHNRRGREEDRNGTDRRSYCSGIWTHFMLLQVKCIDWWLVFSLVVFSQYSTIGISEPGPHRIRIRLQQKGQTHQKINHLKSSRIQILKTCKYR